MKKEKKSFSMPDMYIIIFFVVMLAALLTYVVPQGYFATEDISYEVAGEEKTKTVIVEDSFQYVTDDDGNPVKQGVKLFASGGENQGFLNYMFEGLVTGDKNGSAVGIIAFLLVIGGAFGIVLSTGSVEAGISKMIVKMKGKEILLIPVLFLLFSLGGAVFGMGEEAIPFVLIVVPMTVAMGYDAIVGIMITYCATQIGFATSWMNPFSVAVAQGISQIPVMSGAGLRIIMWIVFNIVSIVFTIMYAKKIKKNPELSVSYESDEFYRKDLESNMGKDIKFGIGDTLIILDIVITLIWVVWGVIKKGYYIPEIATQFFTMGIIAGIIGLVFKLNNTTLNSIALSFRNGSKDLLTAALVIGMAQGIILVLGGTDPAQGTVLNTILFKTSGLIAGLPQALSAWIMYIFQSIFNFFVVSGSGQAALTMPIMAPLADLTGVSRQVAVLAFQLGDGLTNLIVPTSGLLIAVLGAARMDWNRWAKFQVKFQLILFVLASIFMFLAVAIGYQ
ncbi:putative basic amino acid antiporter YfcC [Peptoniphilus stercorisuis]|uniref:Ion transporter superfamily protein YfcC n=1 Tax=Peptoniphilus stercorisuis TaxID=1436965 RepID=A0ABS4KE28_9FIRM|nr:putative basic amino acid antiporter YfcC [Peptoniphilus stercorisuis]MBP2026021.1 putative ion transporter superfamily protein YfcC [Peptoniphilus stercorisuis]